MQILTKLSKTRWQEYKQLRLQAIKDSPQAFLDNLTDVEKRAPELWQQRMQHIYFAQVDSRLVGMIGAYQDERAKLKHILHVVSFFVLPKHRGTGIGKALLSQVLTEAKLKPELKKLQLSVATSQTAAYQLYLSLGFQKIGISKYAVKVDKQYFDEYLMELYLG